MHWCRRARSGRGAFTPEYLENYERILGRGATGETRTRTRANDWLIDREMQRNQNFTGIPGTNTQDLAVQESMGRIVDRSREQLGATDRAIITARRLLLEATAGGPGAAPRRALARCRRAAARRGALTDSSR